MQRSTIVQQEKPKGSLAKRLLEDYAFGYIQAPRVQIYAQLAVEGGCDDELLIDFASMGSYGKHPRNIDTQFKTKIQHTHVVPTLMFIPLVLNILKGVDRGVHALQHA